MAVVYLGIGSNEGEREENIQQAEKLMAEIPETTVQAKSSFKEYRAAEIAEGQAPFLNGVFQIETELKPLELLHKLQVIERRMGRTSKGDGKERVIDLDILTYDEGILFHGKTLTIPHPRMQQRLFVLEPLAELAASWNHPKLHQSVEVMLRALLNPHANDSVASTAEEQADAATTPQA